MGFVLGGALAGTLGLSFAGLVMLRYLGPEFGFRNSAAGLALVIALLTAMLGWLLMRLLLRPIHALEAYAEAQQQGAEPVPPSHFGTRELHATARRVVAMAEALRDREATIRAFTDHVTHEIKTPVSSIRAACELLQDGGALTPADARLVEQIDGARAQIEAQLLALREVARSRETRYLGQTNLAEMLPELRTLRPGLQLEPKGETVSLPIAAQGMLIVLGQLLANAAENGAGRVTLQAEAVGEATRLDVSDDGQGISSGNAERIFDPFFTTRRDEGGTGMGLPVVRNLLHAHGATIRLIPVAEGTHFAIDFASGGA
ncbi:ATP-binding protein [uncultured Paracoccus sp.]|uniref:sensor histidine kinase n=1 Tax=uncultured Paracoccus sp. TaxID=189685 RepID=UPI002604EC0E|nr:ATP-binding protein [uncultured Paracoccus sp.]